MMHADCMPYLRFEKAADRQAWHAPQLMRGHTSTSNVSVLSVPVLFLLFCPGAMQCMKSGSPVTGHVSLSLPAVSGEATA